MTAKKRFDTGISVEMGETQKSKIPPGLHRLVPEVENVLVARMCHYNRFGMRPTHKKWYYSHLNQPEAS
jgi:hypothetical protein